MSDVRKLWYFHRSLCIFQTESSGLTVFAILVGAGQKRQFIYGSNLIFGFLCGRLTHWISNQLPCQRAKQKETQCWGKCVRKTAAPNENSLKIFYSTVSSLQSPVRLLTCIFSCSGNGKYHRSFRIWPALLAIIIS